MFEPKVPGFITVPKHDISAVARAIGPETAAVMLEPIQGEAGVIPFSADFLRHLRDLTRKSGVLLILDEIQTGIGRTGRVFCFEHTGIQPDILTLGKGIGGGVPLAALIAREDICVFQPGDQGGTFNGNALMTAVGCAVVGEITRPEFLAGVRKTGKYLGASLRTLSHERDLGDVRGEGLLLALDLKKDIGRRLAEAALSCGLLINSPRPNVLRFMPALNVSRDEIDQMIRILRQILSR